VKTLKDAIKALNPALVAEEFSEHALRKLSKDTHQEHESITRYIAQSCGIAYRACDPDDVARKKMGYVEGSDLALSIAMSEDGNGLSNSEINSRGFAIEVANYWPLREAYWLQQMTDVLDKDVIFVCGDAHIESFCELLKRKGVEPQVLHQGIGVSQRDAEFWGGVMRYLKEHPELSR
jgi:hypothetical protein